MAVVERVPAMEYTSTKAVRRGDMDRRTPTNDPTLSTLPTKTTSTEMQLEVKVEMSSPMRWSGLST